jgi:hypothetical protein
MLPPGPKVTVTVGEKVLLSILTSNALGGVTRIPCIRFEPDTEKFDDVEAVPYVVLKAEGEPVVVIFGANPDDGDEANTTLG